MRSKLAVSLVFALASVLATVVECNEEGDILNMWRTSLTDPNNVLQSWDPTMVNPCMWLHVTCNLNDTVVRLDLGNAGLSGPLVPQLGSLRNLQYLQVQENKLIGTIPKELGGLKKLISLRLDHNLLTGSIPASIGKLRSLRFLNLNSNKLGGSIPNNFIHLIQSGNLDTLNVSDNQLAGTKRKEVHITSIIQDPKA